MCFAAVVILASQLALAASEEGVALYRGPDRQARLVEGAKQEDWVNLEPVIGKGIVSALAKNAPHPHASMLFLDFFFSSEGGQKVVHEANRIGTHPDLVPDPPRLREGFDFLLIDPVKYMDKIQDYEKLWREWVVGG